MYVVDVWKFPNSIEYEFKYSGNYGAKGEKRQKKKKATPEQIKNQNQANREKYTRRLIKANFVPGDVWATLKYPKGTRKPLEEVMKDWERFRGKMARAYKQRDQPFKFIYRIEVGARGGIHVHILLNRLKDGDTDLLLQEKWSYGRVNYESVYEAGGYEKLANYLVKKPEEDTSEYEQLNLFEPSEQKKLVAINSSRNLIRPSPERKTYVRRTMRRLIEEGPRATEGYYIDKNSIYSGVNRYTGFSYYHYTENRLKEVNTRNGPPNGGRYETG